MKSCSTRLQGRQTPFRGPSTGIIDAFGAKYAGKFVAVRRALLHVFGPVVQACFLDQPLSIGMLPDALTHWES